jgi:glutathione S-transferase
MPNDSPARLKQQRRGIPEGRGETKDLWVQWALEETGLPYRVHALDHTAGELDSDAYGRLSPFRQAPVIDDGGFVVAESSAIVRASPASRSLWAASA